MKQLLTSLLLSFSLLTASIPLAVSADDVINGAANGGATITTNDVVVAGKELQQSAGTHEQPTLVQSLSLFALSRLLGSVPADSTPVDSAVQNTNLSTAEETSPLDAVLSGAAYAVTSTISEVTEMSNKLASSEDDPFEQYNRMMFRFNSVLDEKALRPLAERYREHTPALVRVGFSNFFSNIGDVGVIANDALQGKVEQALMDSSRLTINTIAGLGGFIDVATMLNFKKNNEDFGQTFGVWGIPEGPYLVLPVLGPRTVRSAVGTALDTALQAEALGAVSEVAAGQDMVAELMSLNLVNQREKLLGKEDLLNQAALDPYIFTREAYLAYRRCQVEDCDKIDYQPAAPEEPAGADELDELYELDELDELDLLDNVEQ